MRNAILLVLAAMLMCLGNTALQAACQRCNAGTGYRCALGSEGSGWCQNVDDGGCVQGGGDCCEVPSPSCPANPIPCGCETCCLVDFVRISTFRVFELGPGADLSAFPFLVGTSGLEMIRSKIGDLANVPYSSIALKGGMFHVDGTTSYDVDVDGRLLKGDDGFMMKRDIDADTKALDLQVCKFSPGGAPEVLSFVNIPSDGTLLVASMLDGSPAVLAFEEAHLSANMWNQRGIAIQDAFWDEYAANKIDPTYPMTDSSASEPCM